MSMTRGRDQAPNATQLTASRLVRSLSRFRDLHTDMTVAQLMCFMLIVERPGITQRDLYQLLGMTDSASSRIVAILSDIGSRGTPGLGLVDMRTNPMDRRERLLYLTHRGSRLAEDMQRDLAGGPQHGSQTTR